MIYYALSCTEQVDSSYEPATYPEACTCDIVPLSKGKKNVNCNWIFKRNEGLSPSQPLKYNGRLVAKGFSQIPSVDYNDVFSLVVKHSSIHTFFSIVAAHDLELDQLDVTTTLLHGELEEEIYIDKPEGFIVPGKENYVCKLKRSYGLKQSPPQWYQRFDSFMLSHGFKRSKYDSCVYIKHVNGSLIYLMVHVNDMLIATMSRKEITTIKKLLSRVFHWRLSLSTSCKPSSLTFVTKLRSTEVLVCWHPWFVPLVLGKFSMLKSRVSLRFNFIVFVDFTPSFITCGS
jgi:hypothetical protein